jgi:hypothetical protein
MSQPDITYLKVSGGIIFLKQWGISLILSQGFLLVFGPSILNMPTPFGNFPIEEQIFGIYRLVLFGVSVAMIAGVWAVFTFIESSCLKSITCYVFCVEVGDHRRVRRVSPNSVKNE